MKLKMLPIVVASFIGFSVQAVPIVSPSPIALQAEAQTGVNINTASAQEIASALVGIGVKKAEKLIEMREQLGGFTELEQLLDVKGIGLKTLEKNRANIRLN
ncbi:DNA uptake protein [Idiomarina sp. X4]|uniref:ComEA family DNA-binding protein n=1 Tax=unclassified Idiomarina TaxID=2614829 RepID=UPI000C290F6C|nr:MULTISPECIES: helix-hairpin-helix domain-containing protein [unclassified Idiomarina]ATZ74302.1 DNA uptake protein [Idiomarina sp. X4]RXS44477.1 helix-hairpin-helix domain-containing protein [Idiomarina sp. 29L]